MGIVLTYSRFLDPGAAHKWVLSTQPIVGFSARKAVSLSIQRACRTIPNASPTHQNFLNKDRALRFSGRWSCEIATEYSNRGTACLLAYRVVRLARSFIEQEH